MVKLYIRKDKKNIKAPSDISYINQDLKSHSPQKKLDYFFLVI